MDVTVRRTDQILDLAGSADALLLETFVGRYVLSSQARPLWRLIDGERTVGEIHELLAAGEPTFDGAQMLDWCEEALELGLVEVVGGDPAARADAGASRRSAPAFTVLSRQPATLSSPDLSQAGLLAHFPGLADAQAVCFTGSAAVGWGNAYSDIDLLSFSDEPLDLPIDDTMEMWPGSDPSGVEWITWMGRYGDTRVDLKVLPTNTLETILAPYLDAEPEFCGAGMWAKDFIYRLSVGKTVINDDFFARQRALIEASSYGRALARTLKADVENRLTDVAGQLGTGDDASARIGAMQAAAYAADACLVMAGELCRGEKWIMRRLAATPAAGISAEDYRSSVLDGPKDGESERQYAIRVARWTQRQIIAAEDRMLATGANVPLT
jgi:hypothetical protein